MSSKQTTCPLCGAQFDADAAGACASCPLNRGCSALCCPRCKYSFPAETPIAAMVRRGIERLTGRRVE